MNPQVKRYFFGGKEFYFRTVKPFPRVVICGFQGRKASSDLS